MSKLLEKLSELADQLDGINSIKTANELDELIQEVARRQKQEEIGMPVDCPACDGQGFTAETPFCPTCKGEGKVFLDIVEV